MVSFQNIQEYTKDTYYVSFHPKDMQGSHVTDENKQSSLIEISLLISMHYIFFSLRNVIMYDVNNRETLFR